MSRWLGDSRNDPLNETIENNFETQSEISSEQRVLPSLNKRGQGQDNSMSQEQGSIISAIPVVPALGGSQRGAQQRSSQGQGSQVADDDQSVGNSTIASVIPAAPSLGGAYRNNGAGNQGQGGGQANAPGGAVPTQVGGQGSLEDPFSRPADALDPDIVRSIGVLVRKDQRGFSSSK